MNEFIHYTLANQIPKIQNLFCYTKMLIRANKDFVPAFNNEEQDSAIQDDNERLSGYILIR